MTAPAERPAVSAPGAANLRTGARLTHIGLVFVLFALVVATAATNTGNNALYMVLASMAGTLLVSLLSGWGNVSHLGARCEAQPEVFAGATAWLPLEVRNMGFVLPRWLLQCTLSSLERADLLTHLPRRRRGTAPQHVHLAFDPPRRGTHRLESVKVSTLFPFGFFRITRRLAVHAEVMVFPRLLDTPLSELGVRATGDEETLERLGFGCELLGIRELRPGDDPRALHWKHTARLNRPMVKLRAEEESRRVSIVIDNRGPLDSAEARERFERLVSVAATAAVQLVQQGSSVELISHTENVPFGTGAAQRTALLEALSRIEPAACAGGGLRGGRHALELSIDGLAA